MSSSVEVRANPALIQKGDASRAPLFLLHDSGGTVSYCYRLRNIGRTVYAIHNPSFYSQTKWKGGILGLVEEYIKLIKSVVPSGEILVGGWSLGGQLGIDIGRVLARNRRSKLSVKGIVLIDTMYPYWGPPETVHADVSIDLVLKNIPSDLKESMLRCMDWSKEDCDEWVLRNWKGDIDQLGEVESEEPAPAVLIHANKLIVEETSAGVRCMVDQYKDQKNGWNFFPHQFIAAIWETPVHHFGLFEETSVQETTDMVKRACDLLAED
ncbi:hypothetical protein COCC4DRAFT_200698 [Bipolaris maydis ATCC 48331]|uniref:Thioesterase domain-containing protein n=2 Tax=Cochliobolus heterostrophus TaxID=5016 RepID=M2TKA3_COCH5|nr:uncharacterized protein COCC4DRAFT_200698 [Bipolaris maydis ATCC 48331]EMD97895.1 hypothetical protein COCHEDRAFT_1165283 [Bipolaris maydis C5]KAJ5031954.1 Alpha/Beta hydrolase protein [Bipolaris maydis]ENI02708.1 hypothetical protein COCC4DRAFT_200698 [Bipolaris maydis ATCC 48331]KAJ5059984.1 Alpha/Beta hydrolase protein [Bipolaris maydis]KAJ6202218.1 Alpha/Beta hydrolase protein [Bipolaris maydis]